MSLRKALKFRNIWIGTAMLWIVLYHSGFRMEFGLFKLLKGTGYAGVDICLFASGVGCYFSLEKDPDIFQFLKRRLNRLAPVYYCFIVPWLLWKMTVSWMPLQAVLGNLLWVQSLISWEFHFNWYISGLVVFYLFLPYLKRITDACPGYLWDFLVVLGLFVAGIPFWGVGNAIVILSRMPVLYAGVVCGKLAKQGYVLHKKDFLFLGCLIPVGFGVFLFFSKLFSEMLWEKGLFWYPFALVAPGICIFLSVLAEKTEKYGCLKWMNRFLEMVGAYSFELYLVHLLLYERLMPEIVKRLPNVPNNLLWLATFPVIVFGTWLLNRGAVFAAVLVNKDNKKA